VFFIILYIKMMPVGMEPSAMIDVNRMSSVQLGVNRTAYVSASNAYKHFRPLKTEFYAPSNDKKYVFGNDPLSYIRTSIPANEAPDLKAARPAAVNEKAIRKSSVVFGNDKVDYTTSCPLAKSYRSTDILLSRTRKQFADKARQEGKNEDIQHSVGRKPATDLRVTNYVLGNYNDEDAWVSQAKKDFVHHKETHRRKPTPLSCKSNWFSGSDEVNYNSCAKSSYKYMKAIQKNTKPLR